MAAWTETCRGTVPPWQCDVTEHFTIAYYFDRIEEASMVYADLVGLAEDLRTGVLPRRLRLRFVRELRAGASFHVESARSGSAPVCGLDIALSTRRAATSSPGSKKPGRRQRRPPRGARR
jgi:hypothetical protein